MSRMTPELAEWMRTQKARGCLEADMIKALIDSGHPAKFANQSVHALFNGSEPDDMIPAGVRELSQADVREHVMNAPNHVVAAQHEVHVLFACASPRVVLFGNVLSVAECDELITQSQHKLTRSEVVDPATGGYKLDKARTSEGTHFMNAETPLIDLLEMRVAALTGIPRENQEPLQILHYGIGGEYEPHYDYFSEDSIGEAKQLKNGGQRVATLVMYLNDVEAGGATLFPQLGIETKPRKGCAVYFENVTEQGEIDPRTLHAGAPVGKGEKWIATKWIREAKYA
jgi:prolyl 4-hydroxylase